MFYRSDHLRSHVIRPAGRSERSERFTFLSPIPPSGRNGTSERKREREVSERPASFTSRRSVHTVHLLPFRSERRTKRATSEGRKDVKRKEPTGPVSSRHFPSLRHSLPAGGAATRFGRSDEATGKSRDTMAGTRSGDGKGYKKNEVWRDFNNYSVRLQKSSFLCCDDNRILEIEGTKW